MFSGSLVAIVTPFKNGAFDETAYRELIEFQIANGTHGIVPCGTTGNPPRSRTKNTSTSWRLPWRS